MIHLNLRNVRCAVWRRCLTLSVIIFVLGNIDLSKWVAGGGNHCWLSGSCDVIILEYLIYKFYVLILGTDSSVKTHYWHFKWFRCRECNYGHATQVGFSRHLHMIERQIYDPTQPTITCSMLTIETPEQRH